MMNKILLALSVFVLSLSACKKADKLTQFYIDYEQSVTVSSASPISLPFNIITPDITTNSESVCEANNTHKDLIEQLVLKELKLTITNPSNGNFDFLKSITIYISADGLQEIEMARKDSIPDGMGDIIYLDPASTDLKEYIKKDQFKLRVNTVTDQYILSDYTIRINAKFFVDAKIFRR